MTSRTGAGINAQSKNQARLIIILPLLLPLGACAQSGMASLLDDKPEQSESAAIFKQASLKTEVPQTELQKATSYWGKQFAKNPRDAKSALNYARNLKAMGEKRRALSVLQQSSIFNGDSRALAGEYGRLALELGQTGLANKLLQRADDPARPDWRILSARGTGMAKEGKHKEAIAFFERASVLAPDQASVMNNLAMAYTMDGQAERAEPLLRKAASGNTPAAARARQNLSLVLGLQGKYDEAKTVAAKDMTEASAQSNVTAIREMVKLEPKLSPEAEAERLVQQAKQNAEAMAKAEKAAAKKPKRRTSKAKSKPVYQPAPPIQPVVMRQVPPPAEQVVLRPSNHSGY